MDFRPTDEQQMIVETVEGALSVLCDASALRALVAKDAVYDSERWQALAGLGLCGTLLPEAAGGVGLDDAVFCAVAQAGGAALLPEPLTESAGIALPLLMSLNEAGCVSGLSDDLAALAEGRGHAVLVHPRRALAPHADTARLIVLADDDGLSIGPPDGFSLVSQPTVDPLTRLFTVAAGPGATRVPRGAEIEAALVLAADRGALYTAAALGGVARGAQRLAVAFARDRAQFGRPIGTNQAVKHMLAEVEVELAFLQPVLEAAAALLTRQDVTARAHLANAWLRAVRVADMATRRAVQVHGAMGYSWETDIHLFLKRAMVLGTQWGDGAFHLDRAGSRALADGTGPRALFE